MAGLGSRFADVGYKEIKPLIPIHGKPMIQYAIDSVGLDGNWIFIVQQVHRIHYNLDEILQSICPNCIIVDTGGGLTEGAACSVLLAEKYINNEQPLIVINSDNIIKWKSAEVFDNFIESTDDGMILCFKATDPKWSFAKLGTNSYVEEVAEKNPISDNATVGLYVWRRGRDFVNAAHSMISKNIRTNNEFYLCPVYNENIELGQRISIHMVENMYGVGTPEDLDYYLANFSE
jgi:dTDP-glucose pyrophosphorylase